MKDRIQGMADAHDKVSRGRVKLFQENAALKARVVEVEGENTALRTGMSNVASNLGNGAAAAPNCTLEFMSVHVPTEVKLVCDDLRARALRAEADCVAMREAIVAARVSEVGNSITGVSSPDFLRMKELAKSKHSGADLLAALALAEGRAEKLREGCYATLHKLDIVLKYQGEVALDYMDVKKIVAEFRAHLAANNKGK